MQLRGLTTTFRALEEQGRCEGVLVLPHLLLHWDHLPLLVHAEFVLVALREVPQAGSQCSPGCNPAAGGNPAAGAPPRMLTGQTILLSERIPGQLTEQVAQTACRCVCTDLGPSWLRKHSQHSGSNPK